MYPWWDPNKLLTSNFSNQKPLSWCLKQIVQQVVIWVLERMSNSMLSVYRVWCTLLLRCKWNRTEKMWSWTWICKDPYGSTWTGIMENLFSKTIKWNKTKKSHFPPHFFQYSKSFSKRKTYFTMATENPQFNSLRERMP